MLLSKSNGTETEGNRTWNGPVSQLIDKETSLPDAKSVAVTRLFLQYTLNFANDNDTFWPSPYKDMGANSSLQIFG